MYSQRAPKIRTGAARRACRAGGARRLRAVMVTHDLQYIRFVDRALTMHEGRLTARTPEDKAALALACAVRRTPTTARPRRRRRAGHPSLLLNCHSGRSSGRISRVRTPIGTMSMAGWRPWTPDCADLRYRSGPPASESRPDASPGLRGDGPVINSKVLRTRQDQPSQAVIKLNKEHVQG